MFIFPYVCCSCRLHVCTGFTGTAAMVAMHCRGAIEHTPVHSGDNLHSSCSKCWNKSAMMLKFLRDFCDTSKKPPLKASMI